jgi:hypothetical protein
MTAPASYASNGNMAAPPVVVGFCNRRDDDDDDDDDDKPRKCDWTDRIEHDDKPMRKMLAGVGIRIVVVAGRRYSLRTNSSGLDHFYEVVK